MQMLTGENGIGNLSNVTSINSQGVSYSHTSRGVDATTASWPSFAGTTLAVAGSGADPSVDNLSYGNGDLDRYVTGGGTKKYYVSATVTDGDIATGDICIDAETIVPVSNAIMARKRNAGVGWEMGFDAENRAYFTMQDSLVTGGIYTVVGDSRTVGRITDAYTNTLDAEYSTARTFNNFGVNGIRATNIVNYPLLNAIGEINSVFTTTRYPWLANGTSLAIVSNTLEITRSAAGYAYMPCLPTGKQVTISGNYTSANTTLLEIRTSEGGGTPILTTIADGAFSVNYTASANGVEVRMGTSSGLAGDKIYVSDIKIELTDKSDCADVACINWAGINDVISDLSTSTITDALDFFAEQCILASIEPAFITLLEFGNNGDYSAPREAVRVAVNAHIRASGHRYVDCNFLADGTDIAAAYDYGDGLHCNALGYSIIGELVISHLMDVTIYSAALTAGDTVKAKLYIDRSGSGQFTINGANSGSAVVVSGSAASLSNSGNLALFSDTFGECSIIRWALASKDAWFSTHLNASDALDDFYKWTGLDAIKSTGNSAPNFFTRATEGYVDKYDSTTGYTSMIKCSSGLPRIGTIRDDSGNVFSGLLKEDTVENVIPYSNDINNAAWDKTLVSIDTSTGVSTSDPDTDFQGIVSSAASANHYIREDYVYANSTYCWSAEMKKGDQTWVRFYIGDGQSAYFNLETGLLDGTQTFDDAGIIDKGNGRLLCWATATATGGSMAFQIHPSSSSTSSSSTTGDGSTVSTYVSFVQVELGNYPTSRIVTSGTAKTRNADLLQYSGADNITAGQGTVVCEVLIGARTPASELSIATISDGGSTDEMIRTYVDSGTVVPIFEAVDSTVSQWTITGTTDVADGSKHTVRCLWENNNAKQYVDNTLDGTPDTSCTAPTGLDEIDIGQNSSSSMQLNGWIRNFRIYGFASSDV